MVCPIPTESGKKLFVKNRKKAREKKAGKSAAKKKGPISVGCSSPIPFFCL